MRLRNRVAEIRASRRYSQSDLARIAGVDRKVVGWIEADQGYTPSSAVMLRLASALGVPMNDLFWSEDAPAPAEVAS